MERMTFSSVLTGKYYAFHYTSLLSAGWNSDVMAGAGVTILGHKVTLVMKVVHSKIETHHRSLMQTLSFSS